MKSFFFILIGFVMNAAFAQTAPEALSATTLAPFAGTSRLLETGLVVSLAPTGWTLMSARIRARGTAGIEQLRDDLAGLNNDMLNGKVKMIQNVRQLALKELINEISKDDEQMEEIQSVIKAGSKLQRISIALTLNLFSAEELR